MWKIGRALNNASKGQIRFNSAFKGLICQGYSKIIKKVQNDKVQAPKHYTTSCWIHQDLSRERVRFYEIHRFYFFCLQSAAPLRLFPQIDIRNPYLIEELKRVRGWRIIYNGLYLPLIQTLQLPSPC